MDSTIIEQLQLAAKQAKQRDIVDLFVDDRLRADEFIATGAGISLDFAKQNISPCELNTLIRWAQGQQLGDSIQSMFNGEGINHTEQRAVLHTLLRAPQLEKQAVLGIEQAQEVIETEQRMAALVKGIHAGEIVSVSGKPYTHVLAIGIGGSFYGVKVGLSALQPYCTDKLDVKIIANVDGGAITEKLARLPAESTLVIVISKTFTTQETLLNAQAVKDWQLAHFSSQQANEVMAKHWLAISTNITAVNAFGISKSNTFPMWDWVGGRFSVWSAVGLPLALAIGIERFEQFKHGAYLMDCHFRQSDYQHNLPILLALIGIWNRNYLDYSALAILPYDHALRALPGYLQQTDMESNGKSVDHQGLPLSCHTAPIVFGQEGTNGQHAFMQLMHQSTEIIPTDFIVALQGSSQFKEHHRVLVANCFAQSEALMTGKSLAQAQQEMQSKGATDKEIERLAAHKVMKGNTPSNTLYFEKLTPQTFGALLALYEHKIFVQGALWQVNSFDQWGVELGKQLGQNILSTMAGDQQSTLSSSTHKLIQAFNRVNN